jgi:nucleotide-binding universal stress UspA family protein
MVPMDLTSEAEQRARLATALADRFSSRLIGLAAHPIAVPMYVEAPVPGVASAIELQERQATHHIAAAEAVFRRAVATRNRVEWRQTHGFPMDFALEQARAADLIIASHGSRDPAARGPMSLDSGDLVMRAGRPVLFVPSGLDYLAAKCIVVAWKDTREARRAVTDALPFLQAAKEVVVVSVGGSDQSIKDVCAHLACHDVDASSVRRAKPEAAAAAELLHVARQQSADLIVCGAYGHSRAREGLLGGVTRELLDQARLSCLMAH